MNVFAIQRAEEHLAPRSELAWRTGEKSWKSLITAISGVGHCTRPQSPSSRSPLFCD